MAVEESYLTAEALTGIVVRYAAEQLLPMFQRMSVCSSRAKSLS